MLGSALLLLTLSQQAGHLASHLVVPDGVDSWALADFDGDGDVDLVLAATDGEGRRVLRVHTQEQGVVFSAEAVAEIDVPGAVVCWGVGNFLADPGDEIVYLARDAVWLRTPQGRLQKLHAAPMLLDMPAADALPRWRPIADVDGDGDAEILLVTARGFELVGSDGTLLAEVALQPSTRRAPNASRALFGGALRATMSSEELSDLFVPNEEAGVLEPPPALYSEVALPRPEFVDADGDGRLDISWYADNAVHLRLQAADGSFPDDRVQTLELPEEDPFENGYLAWRDAGGGRQADLVLTRSNRDAISFRSDWQVMVWLDAASHATLPPPDAFLKVEAGYVRAHVGDWNGDGRRDLGISAWSVDAGLLAGADASLEHVATLYLARDGGWAQRPALAHRRSYALDDVAAFRDLEALIPDATGDGLPDLLEADERGVLEIRRFLDGSSGLRLAPDPEVRISVDALAAEVVVADLNGDGITDFLIAKSGLWQVHLSYRR